DVELDGERLVAGDLVSVGIASANRDDALYDDADAVRLDRDDPRNHLGFGGGPHVCPGATLARMEAVTSMDVLLDRVTEMAPGPGATYPRVTRESRRPRRPLPAGAQRPLPPPGARPPGGRAPLSRGGPR